MNNEMMDSLSMIPMLDVSTGHLEYNTVLYLENECQLVPDDRRLIVYSKDGYGFFICVNEDSFNDDLSHDLLAVLKYAASLKAQWIMLDQDSVIHESLPFYQW